MMLQMTKWRSSLILTILTFAVQDMIHDRLENRHEGWQDKKA